MTICMKSFHCICKNLECSPSDEAKEALDVLKMFRAVFESADAAIENPILQEICRELPKLHFKTRFPLSTKPIETIQREYQKRTGDAINLFFCVLAYYNTLRADRIKALNKEIIDADILQLKHLKERMIEKREQIRCREEMKNCSCGNETKPCACGNETKNCSCRNETKNCSCGNETKPCTCGNGTKNCICRGGN